MKKFVPILALIFVTKIFSQTTLQKIDFETAGSGYTVSPQEYSTGLGSSFPDYYKRTDGTDITPSVTFTNKQGTYFFSGEDLDNLAASYTVTGDALSISGYENLQIKLLVGGSGVGYTKEGEEYLKIQYQIDGGGFTTLAQFLGNGSYYTEDSDADGTVDGSNIDTPMQEFTYSIPTTGSTLQVRLEAFNGGSEEIAFDNIRILGTVVLPVELISFIAMVKNNIVELRWETATELNNYGFEIERARLRSSNSARVLWEKIGFVNGHGNSNSPKSYEYIDENVIEGKNLYRLKQIDFDGSYEYTDEVEVSFTKSLEKEFVLHQNYPNPFNPTTTIKFTIPFSGRDQGESVRLTIYDILGNEIATLLEERKQPGKYRIEFEGGDLSSGIYYYTLETGNFRETKKMLLIK